MQWASAVSSEERLASAITALERDLKPSLGRRPDLAIAFVSPHYRDVCDQLPALVFDHFSPRAFIGCTAVGVIGGGREVEQQPALSLTLASLPGVDLRLFHLENDRLPDLDSSPQEWVKLTGVSPQPPPHFILLADPATFDPRPLLMGLDFAYSSGTKIGGLASVMEGNALFLDQEIFAAGLVGAALQGDIAVDTVVAQGCRPLGQPMTITRCRDHFLFELDERPAVEVLMELYQQSPPEDQELMRHALHLGIASTELQDSFRQGDFLIRNVMQIGRDPDFIVIGDLLRQGQTVQFHLRDACTAAEDLELMLRQYQARPAPTPPAGALLFTCTGRGQYLYQRPNHDSDLFMEKLGEIPLGGFFCGGEIGQVGAATHLHGYTSSFGIFRPLRA